MGSSAGRATFRLAVGFFLLFLGGAETGFGQIVITEVMQNPRAVSDANGEWFELHNRGTSAVDINGWKIKDDASSNEMHTISKQGGLSIPAGGYIVLAEEGSSTVNGGITPDYDYATISLGNGTDGLVITNGSDVEQDRVVWDNGSTFPDPNGASMALKMPDLDNSVGANWCTATTTYGSGDMGTPGAANDCPAGPPIPDPLTGEIFAIQTAAAASPQALGMATTNDNVVTAVGAGGFFIQTPTARSDAKVDTSDGIFVVHTGAPSVAVGDMVDVVGTVEEFFGFTRIDATGDGGSVTVDSSNAALPDPVEFSAVRPSTDPANASCAIEYECYEGMRIRLARGTVVSGSQHFGSDPVAEMYVTATASRPFREKGVAYPGVSGNANIPVWDGNPEVFELDPDKLGLPNVSWVPGTTFSATGVLGYEFGGWELWATELTRIASGPPLPRRVRARSAGEVTVASLNVLNLRENASQTKLGKLSSYVLGSLGSPDVIAIQEVYGLAALENLAARIKADDPNVGYAAYVEAPGSGSQAVGFLTRSEVTVNSVTEHGRSETFIDPRDGSVDTLHDRPPLLLDAAVGGFLEFSVIVLHNRSLSGIDDTARGGWVRKKRLEQAQSVARLAQTLQTSKLLIVGDYNAYQFTDGYVDVVGQIAGNVTASENVLAGADLVNPNLSNLVDDLPGAERYSFVFRGNAQALDHALVNQEMAGSVREMQYARGNADAAGAAADRAGSPLAASDHDGFVVYLSAPGRPAPGGSGGPSGPGDAPEADLDVDAESQLVSASKVRYRVNVDNAGPDTARNVVVTSSFSGTNALVKVATSGCEEDPDGVPDCTLGAIPAGGSASFTIDVDTGGGSDPSLRYRATVRSDAADPGPGDDEVEIAQPLSPPQAPTELVATALSGTEIELRWRDNSLTETEFAIFLQGPGDARLRLIGTAPANSTSTIVTELVPNVSYGFAVEARNGPLHSERTPTVEASTWTVETAQCEEDDVLCLGRFQVEVEWEDGQGRTGRGMAERLTARSGDFWFFEPANIELVVKVLDGCSLNGHYWVFAVGLTDVALTMKVRDLRAGSPVAGVPTSRAEKTWTSPGGVPFGPIADAAAFDTCDVDASSRPRNVVSGAALGRFDRALSTGPRSRPGEPFGSALPASAASCSQDHAALCLQDGRYEVTADWRAGERNGAAVGIPRTADTGMFWFFSPDNVELVVKVLDGCHLNEHRWVLMGGLTDVGVEITVTDSQSDVAKTYRHVEGAPFETRFDLKAFPCGAGS